MRRFLSRVSSVAILFCLVGQGNVIAMDMKEESSLSHLRGPIASSRSVEKMREGVSLKYETFNAADSDLRRRLPLLLKMVENAQKKTFERVSSLKDFLTIFNDCMDQLKTPFKLEFDDGSHVTLLDAPFLGEDELTFLSLFGYEENIPKTREGKAFKKRQDEAFVAFWENLGAYSSEPQKKIEIERIIDLAKIVCDTTIGLLSCKEKVVLDPLEKETLQISSIKTCQRYGRYIDSLKESMTDGKSLFIIIGKRAENFSNIFPLLRNLERFYISQNRIGDYLQSMRLDRKYLGLALKEETFLYEACPKNEEETIASKLKNIEKILGVLSDSAFVEATNYYNLKRYENARHALEEAINYVQKIKNFNLKPSLLKEKKEKIEGLTFMIDRQENSQVLKRKLRPERHKFLEKILEGTIYPKHKELMSLIESVLIDKKNSSVQELCDLQKKVIFFENEVLGMEDGMTLSSEQVVRFYEKYNEQLQKNSEIIKIGTYGFIRVFVAVGQFENALAHINGFKAIYKGIDKDCIFKDLDMKRALIKSFQGDSAEFLALVEAYHIEQAQTEEQKEKRKEEKEKTHAAIVQAAQKKAAHSKSPKELQSSNPSLEVKQRLRTSREPSSYNLSLASSEIAPSTEEEKEKKRERHHEKSEERRKEFEQEALRDQGAAAVVDEDAEEARGGAQAEAVAVREDIWFPFGGNIELKTLQKRVDLQIEQNSWKFTKLDLERYYEEFGCKVSQNGRHTKAALPGYKDVRLPDGMLLSLIFGKMNVAYEGGAFTLPNWQDQVPFYLRKQILKAREKIQAYFDLLDKAVLLQSEQGRET